MYALTKIVLCLTVVTCLFSERRVQSEETAEAQREVKDEFEMMLEALQNKYVKRSEEEEEDDTRVYQKRSDTFDDTNYHPIFSDGSLVRADRQMNSITAPQIKAIVDLHNKLRRQEGSSDMETLRYNQQIADLAQEWSKKCRFEHGYPPFNAKTIGYETLGQNIYSDESPKFTTDMAVQAWYDEKKDYKYESTSCGAGKVCGHYTAVTWAKTTDVGCGITFCPSISGLKNAHFIVCNYAPAGNFNNEKPFRKGTACSQCNTGKFFCNNDMCDKSCSSAGANCVCKAACKKCGAKDAGSCSCKCRAGTSGPDCSDECIDTDTQCGANPGLPEMTCEMAGFEFVKVKCPKLCHICEGPNPKDKPCMERENEMDKNALKRLMLDYLENEKKSGRLEK